MKKFLIKILAVSFLSIVFVFLLSMRIKTPIEKDLDKITDFMFSNAKTEKIDKGTDEVLVIYYSIRNEIYHIVTATEKGKRFAKAVMINHIIFDIKQIFPITNLYQFKNLREEGYKRGKVLFEENIYDYLADGEIDYFRIFTRSGELDFGYVIRKGVTLAQDKYRNVTKKEERMMMIKYRNIVKTILKHYGK